MTHEPVPITVFTSGSTGKPKGVVISWRAIEAAVEMNEKRLGRKEDDRWLLALPVEHVSGLGVVMRCRLRGIPMETVGEEGLRAALERDVTLVSLVPAQLSGLLEDEAWVPPKKLRAVLLGGAAASEGLVARARARGVPVLLTYGMTETFGQVATEPPGERAPKGAVGKPLEGVVIEAGTREAPGRIVIATPAAFDRYVDEEREDPEKVVTNDLGFMEDGWLYVVGRIDDIIVTGGKKVHPSTVENVIAKVDGVKAVCVAGVPDEKWGQRIGAVIVGEPVGLDAVIAGMATHLRPRIVRIVDALPLGPTGKVDRRACAEILRDVAGEVGRPEGAEEEGAEA